MVGEEWVPHLELKNLVLVPDLMTMAKATTNGIVPMGVVACKEEIYDAIMDACTKRNNVELFHGYTYSGIPVSVAAAALAVQEIFEKEDIFNRVKRNGTLLSRKQYFHLKDIEFS